MKEKQGPVRAKNVCFGPDRFGSDKNQGRGIRILPVEIYICRGADKTAATAATTASISVSTASIA